MKNKNILIFIFYFFITSFVFSYKYQDKINYTNALMKLGMYDMAFQKATWLEKRYGQKTEIEYLKANILMKQKNPSGRKMLSMIHHKYPMYKRDKIMKELGIAKPVSRVTSVLKKNTVNTNILSNNPKRKESFYSKLKKKLKQTAYYQLLGGVVLGFFALPM